MTVKSNYTLDNRIKSMDDVQTCLQYDDSYIGERGYFATDFSDLSDLSNCVYSTLAQIISDGAGDDIFRTSHDVDYDNWGSRFFVPERLLKSVEKKYRPYKDVQEFFNDIGCTIGDTILFRRYDKTEYTILITGATCDSKGTTRIGLGCIGFYSMEELYEIFEIWTDSNGWQKLGIIKE